MRDYSLDGGSDPVAADVDADAEEQNYQCAGCNRPKQSDYEKLPEWAKLTPSDLVQPPGHLMQPVVRSRNPEYTTDKTKPSRLTEPVVSNIGRPVLYQRMYLCCLICTYSGPKFAPNMDKIDEETENKKELQRAMKEELITSLTESLTASLTHMLTRSLKA